MAGTYISYQGFPGRRCVFRRSRGYSSDWSYVDIPVQQFKGKFKFKEPRAGDGPTNFNGVLLGTGAKDVPEDGKVDAGRAPMEMVAEGLAAELDHFGTLTMAEVDQDGRVFRVDVTLYVAKMETVLETFTVNVVKSNSTGQKVTVAETGSLSMLRVHLVDVRYFWTRGVLRQWSFNRWNRHTEPSPRISVEGLGEPARVPRPVQTFAPDSVDSNGKPFTRKAIAGRVTSDLFGRPTLAKVPASWDTEFQLGVVNPKVFSFQRPPFESAVSALKALVDGGGVEEPILRLDEQLELREAGDGVIGPMLAGGGPNSNRDTSAIQPSAQGVPDRSIDQNQMSVWNRSALDGFRLWKGGEGQSTSREPQYSDDVVVVVGQPIVASVAIDDWEPVLLISKNDLRYLPGTDPKDTVYEILPLNDETVRRLTAIGVPANVQKTGENSYVPIVLGIDWLRMWILAPESNRNDPAVLPGILELFRKQAWRMWRMPGIVNPDGSQGPNANMLPLLPRAELFGGKRMPVTVERFGYAARHHEFTASEVQNQLDRANTDLLKLEDEIRVAAGIHDPFRAKIEWRLFGGANGSKPIEGGRAFRFNSKIFISYSVYLEAAKKQGVTLTSSGTLFGLKAAIDKARLFEHIADTTTATTAASYEELVRRINTLNRVKNGGQPLNEILDVAKKLVLVERNITTLQRGSLGRDEDDNGLRQLGKRIVDEFPGVRKSERPKTLLEFLENSPAFLAVVPDIVTSDRAFAAARQQLNTQKTLHQDGSIGASEYGSPVSYRNLPRLIDGQARVVDAELGIVQTSELAGHLAFERATDTEWEGRPFVPRPVRVVFGTQIAPKVQRVGQVQMVINDLGVPGTDRLFAGQIPGNDPSDPAELLKIEDDKNTASLDAPPKEKDSDTPNVDALLRKDTPAVPELSERGKAAEAEVKLRLKETDQRLEAIRKEQAVLYLLNKTPGQATRKTELQEKLEAEVARLQEVLKNPEGIFADSAMAGIFGGDNVRPPDVLREFETYFRHVWKRLPQQVNDVGAPQDPSSINMVRLERPSPQDLWNATTVSRPDLEALIPLGRTEPIAEDQAKLAIQTKEAALSLFRRQTLLKIGRHLFARPWPINCDGRVASVEIKSIDYEGAPCGFETLVMEGNSAFDMRNSGARTQAFGSNP